jgi:hypothetical protein
LFTLGIQNSMNYNVDVILLIMLMFYLVCTTLIISIHFPFTSKPERIYAGLRQRFFAHCARSIRLNAAEPGIATALSRVRLGNGAALLAKMQSWGAMIDEKYFPANSRQQVIALNRACELLHGQLQVLALRQSDYAQNPLIDTARRQSKGSPLANLCNTLAAMDTDQPFLQLRDSLMDIESQLDKLLGEDYLEKYDRHQLAQFYVYLNQQASILGSLESCHKAQAELDWQQLAGSRF